jgi:hypothetical protein
MVLPSTGRGDDDLIIMNLLVVDIPASAAIPPHGSRDSALSLGIPSAARDSTRSAARAARLTAAVSRRAAPAANAPSTSGAIASAAHFRSTPSARTRPATRLWRASVCERTSGRTGFSSSRISSPALRNASAKCRVGERACQHSEQRRDGRAPREILRSTAARSPAIVGSSRLEELRRQPLPWSESADRRRHD